jgi:O-antigen/teichoic acid export membrane protein
MINKIKQKIKPGSFLRNVLTVASGTVIAQAITVFVSPIITRMYTPSDMGVLASFTAIVAILGVIAAGRYELAIVLPETDKLSNAVSVAALTFALIFGLIITFVTIVFNKPLVSLLKLQGDAASWSYLLGFFVFLTGTEQVLNRLAIRNRHFKVIASTQVTQQLSASGIKIVWGYFSPGTLGLFIGTLFSSLSRIVRLAIDEIKTVFSKENRPSWADIKHSVIRYKKFPLIDIWSGLLNSTSIQIPVVLFTALFSPAIAGFYSLSHRVLSLPMSLIGSSVTNVFLERAAKAKDDDEELGRITLELYRKLIFIGSIVMSFVTFYGDSFFPFIFGEKWVEAGRYAQWISIWLVFQFAYSPISIIYTIKELQIEAFVLNLFFLIIRVSFVIPYFLGFVDIYNIIAIYSISSLLFYITGSCRLFFIVKKNHFEFMKIIAIYLLIPYSFQGIIFEIISNIIK